MKKIILLCLMSATATNLFSGEAMDKLLELQKKHQNNITAKHSLRVKLITEDADIKRLHQRIMALHKELALKINAKKPMRILIAEQKQLATQIVLQKAAVMAELKEASKKE
jgi:glucose-6-phosphate-specific signal transduction histidine kinase